MGIIVGVSISEYLSHPYEAAKIASIMVAIAVILYVLGSFKISIKGMILRSLGSMLDRVGLFVYNKELKFNKELEIGKINIRHRKVKIYRFINDLIIDLGLKSKGITPISFIIIILVGSAFISLVICKLAFDNILLSIFSYPIITVAVVCTLYTRANMAHDLRIEAVIEAENIISNNIKGGVVVSIRNSMYMMPEIVRGDFRDFLDNVDYKNFHIRIALMELNNSLGSVSDDFIKKCIEFETQEEHGIIGMFNDVVELNNIKTELRNEMKRSFEQIFANFVIGATMIFTFLGGTLVIFENVANFYFNNIIGQLILIIDALIIISEFVFITYLRAKEL